MRTFATIGWQRTTAAACAAAVLGLVGAPRTAQACGGTFCDIGPRAMPVDQTGENILFVVDGGKVEAHIQIQYRGDAARFSWILPVPALPEVEVGSDPLFARLLASTVPNYGYATQRDVCGGSTGGSGGTGGPPGSGGAGGGGAVDSGVGIVVAQKQVGAFETTTLSGAADEVVKWLASNGYQMSAEAPGLFQDYVARGYLFVAVKLTGGAGIDQIHPLVVRYAGSKPCVPIKLTRVAAAEDMGIRTFFLGKARVGPTNFKSIALNPVMLDWMALGTNYKALVSHAVDSPVANGKGFVTEYAGPTAIVGASRLTPAAWDPTVFASLSSVAAVLQMRQQGFFSCATGPRFVDGGTFPPAYLPFCVSSHPLVLPLLRDFVPPPAMLNLNDGGQVVTDPATIEGYIYDCPSCFANQIDASKWDAAKFVAALTDRVVGPSRHADSLLAVWPYLTRMFTTISPAEMTEDPEFEAMPDLPTQGLPLRGIRRITCTGESGMTLPDMRSVALTPASTWPGFTSEMPWVEKIEELPSRLMLVDNTDRIDKLLKTWNDSRGWPPNPGGGGGGGSGTGGSGTTGGGGLGGTGGIGGSGGTGGIGGSGGTGGTGGIGGSGGGETNDTSRADCRCNIGHRVSSKSALSLMMTAGLVLRRVRRRR